jgi:hypothetical protein
MARGRLSRRMVGPPRLLQYNGDQLTGRTWHSIASVRPTSLVAPQLSAIRNGKPAPLAILAHEVAAEGLQMGDLAFDLVWIWAWA